MTKKSDEILHINHSGECLIWLVIIFVIVSLSSTFLFFKDNNDKNDYQIFLQDVDGLIVGSPVRMMGIEVGHVTHIKPMGDEVFVNFVLKRDDVYIPQGTDVTVEFTGLAGSKSLELYLPQGDKYIDKTSSVLEVQPPKRLHDAMSLLNDMFKKLGSIIYTTSDFGTKLNQTEFPKSSLFENKNNAQVFLKFSDKFLDDSTQKAADMRHSLNKLKNGD